MIKIGIVDDHVIVRSGLKQFFLSKLTCVLQARRPVAARQLTWFAMLSWMFW